MDWTSLYEDTGEEPVPLLETRAARSSKQIKSYSSIVAYAFALNYVLGIGNLALPFALYKAGLILGFFIGILFVFYEHSL
jgi:hypothetical protein